MAKPRKEWIRSPAKSPKPAVPDAIKAELEVKAAHLIETVLKPKHVRPPKKDAQLNYITDIGGKWHGKYYYFVATYACPGPNAIAPTFESKFARLEHSGEGKFTLSFFRHTGKWFPIFQALTVDECLEAIRDDAWFEP
jgi:hypothetical protein